MSPLESNINTIVRLMRIRPIQLIDYIRGSHSDAEIREALSTMISLGELVLTAEQFLEIPIPFK